jgi:hypothetical protein
MQPGAYKQAFSWSLWKFVHVTGTGGAGSSNLGGIDAGTSQYSRVLWYMQNLSTDEVV